MFSHSPDPRSRILGYLAENPDSTSAEIAGGIGADEWDVSRAICDMHIDGLVLRTGRKKIEGRGVRPTYDVQERVAGDRTPGAPALQQEKINGSQ